MTGDYDYYDAGGLSASFYDVVARHDPTLEGELAYYEGLIPDGTWVLELGCGTGRVGLPLAERNRAVVGVDIAPAMLARAEAKRARLAPEVIQRTAFVLGDMTRFDLQHPFDAVIAPFFSVSHLAPGEPRRSMLRCVAAHLKPGGIAALHAILPSAVVHEQTEAMGRTVLDVEYDAKGSRLQIRIPKQSFDPSTGRFEQLLDYTAVSPDGAPVRTTRERLVYHVSDLAEEARGSGLSLVEKVSPFNRVGEMWVFRKD